MAGTGNKPYKVNKVLCKNCDKLFACTSELAVGQILQFMSKGHVTLIHFSPNHGGTGWQALTANIGCALVYAFCGMCLTAEGTVLLLLN
jgi:hypothetical protein